RCRGSWSPGLRRRPRSRLCSKRVERSARRPPAEGSLRPSPAREGGLKGGVKAIPLTEHFSGRLTSCGDRWGIKKLGPGDFSTPAPSLAAGGEVLIQFEEPEHNERTPREV